jgi:ERCC4-type nuclease
MYLLIDYREQDFIKRVSELYIKSQDLNKETNTEILTDDVISINILNTCVYCKITSLPIGDFIIQENVDDTNTIKMIIERKNIKDLCSSITDGRFREQKQRLLDSINDPDKICYLIEGNKQVSNLSLSDTIINGSILNLLFKHKYHLIQSENKLDTFNIIVLLYKKYKNGDFKESQNKVSSIKLLKRSDKITENKMIHQLCLIPGVSQKIAQTITNYPLTSIKCLIDLYNTLEDQTKKEMLLSELIIDETNKKPRKIGKALSKKIYEYFCK